MHWKAAVTKKKTNSYATFYRRDISISIEYNHVCFRQLCQKMLYCVNEACHLSHPAYRGALINHLNNFFSMWNRRPTFARCLLEFAKLSLSHIQGGRRSQLGQAKVTMELDTLLFPGTYQTFNTNSKKSMETKISNVWKKETISFFDFLSSPVWTILKCRYVEMI